MGKELSRDAEGYRSRHRIKAAVNGLGSGAALMCLVIDVRRAIAASNSDDAKEVLGRLEPVIAELDKDVFPSLGANAPRIQEDPLVAAAVRKRVGEMAVTFARIRGVYASRKNVDNNTLLGWKQAEKRLITELCAALKLEVPQGLMVAFEDHSPQQQQAIITMGPQGLGTYSRRLVPRSRLGTPGNPARPPAAGHPLNAIRAIEPVVAVSVASATVPGSPTRCRST